MVGLSSRCARSIWLTEMLDSRRQCRRPRPRRLARVSGPPLAGEKLSDGSTASTLRCFRTRRTRRWCRKCELGRSGQRRTRCSRRQDATSRGGRRACKDAASAGRTMRRQVSAVSPRTPSPAVAFAGLVWVGRDGGKSAVDLGGAKALRRATAASRRKRTRKRKMTPSKYRLRLQVHEAGARRGAADQRPSLRRGDSGGWRDGAIACPVLERFRRPEGSPHGLDGGDGRNVEGDGGGLVGRAGRGGPLLVACRPCERRFAAATRWHSTSRRGAASVPAGGGEPAARSPASSSAWSCCGGCSCSSR